jgi:hypothetical protein
MNGVVQGIIQVLNVLAMIVPVLLGTGFLVKYLPFMRNLSNQAIPLLNAVLAFLGLFAVPAAHAGVFDGLGEVFTVPAKAAAAFLISGLASWLHDRFLKGLLPAGPQPTAAGK